MTFELREVLFKIGYGFCINFDDKDFYIFFQKELGEHSSTGTYFQYFIIPYF